jgi:hypothetical protein
MESAIIWEDSMEDIILPVDTAKCMENGYISMMLPYQKFQRKTW